MFKFQRVAYIMLLFFYILRWWQGVWLYQLSEPIYISPMADNMYWLLHILNIPQYILSNIILGLSVDLGIVLGCAIMAWQPQYKWGAKGIFILFLMYMVSYNSSLLHHTHSVFPYLLVSLLLCVKSNRNWRYYIELGALYAAGTMLLAGLWKLGRLTAFDTEQMSIILQNQHVDILFFKPESIWAHIYSYLIAHKKLSFLLWHGAVWLELGFVIAFFTKRWDNMLIAALGLFVVMDYVVMGLYFFEFLMLGAVVYGRRGEG